MSAAAGASKMQSSRYEIKYILSDQMALRVRDYVLNYLNPDEHTVPDSFGYPVHSLYLDSSDYYLCWSVIEGEKNRIKLRVRFYEDEPGPQAPFFFEIKRRMNDVISKQRAAVWRDSAIELINGRMPRRSDLISDNDKGYRSLYNFWEKLQRLQAKPAVYVSYLREAYEPPKSNEVRVTFDRQISAGKWEGFLGIKGLENWPRPDVKGVVLELKFTDRFPRWMHDLVQMFDLPRLMCAKYVSCVTMLKSVPSEMRKMGNVQLFPR